jgi:alpha-glucosidase (family GH31 glycosyl hydrolase)
MIKKSYLLLFISVFVFQVTRPQQYRRTNTGVITHTSAINVEVQFFTPSIIRITKFRDSVMPAVKSISVTKPADKVDLQVVKSGYELFINSSTLQVKVNQQSGLVNFYSEAGFPLLDEKEDAFQFTPVGNSTDKNYRVSQTFQLDEEEAVFGLGQQQKGLMNQRGQVLVIRHDNAWQTAPFLLSVKGYGLLWDNYSTTTFKDTTDGTTFASELAPAIDYYFIHGGTADKVIAGYRRLTGPAALYPQWVFGYGKNRNSDKGKDDNSDNKKYRQLQAAQDGVSMAQFASVTTAVTEDLAPQWALLRAQIAAGCNLSVNGIPYYDSDINNFLAKDKFPNAAKDAAFHELYVRWLQFGAFCPMLCSEGESLPGGVYQFGKKGYWAYDAIDKFMALRYRLLPYNYSNAWDVSSKSGIMMRALVMDFPSDKKAWNINNQYMFGKSLMVCPVTSSQYITRSGGEAVADFSKTRTKKIYLPFGNDWFDFWTGEKVGGGTDVFKEIPIDLIPIYVKSGSIVPMMQSTSEADGSVEIRVYEGADGTFTLYEDENDNYNYEKGVYSTIPMKWNNATRTFSIGARKGSFPGMLQNRTFRIVMVSNNKGAGMEAPARYDKVVNYSGSTVNIRL